MTTDNPPPKGLGATGRFPQGKVNADDFGELKFAVGESSTKVLVNFGDKPVSAIGMTPDQAVKVAGALIAHARSVAKKTGQILSITI